MDLDRIRAGERLLNLGRFEEARQCFAGGTADDLQALFGCAVACHMLGRLEEADALYQRTLAAEPGHQEALANLIAICVERFDLAGVEQYSRRLLELNADSNTALQGLVIVAVERRDFETAAHYYGRVIPAAGPDNDAIEYRLSRQALERLRSFHGAVTHPY